MNQNLVFSSTASATRPAPVQARSAPGGRLAASRAVLHSHLVGVWEEVLGVRPIDITDDFFALGGDTLLAVRMLDRVADVTGQQIPLARLDAGATIEHIAHAILEQELADVQLPVVPVQAGGARTPFFFLPGIGLSLGLSGANLARYLDPEQPFYMLPPLHVIDNARRPTIEAMARTSLRALLSVQPHGPYLLGGYCTTGGFVALELARRLQERGERIDLLIVVDAVAPSPRLALLLDSLRLAGRMARIDPEHAVDWGLHLRRRWRHLARLSWGERMQKLLIRTYRAVKRTDPRRAAPGQTQHRHPEKADALEAYQWDLVTASLRAVAAYAPRPYNGCITLVRPHAGVVRQAADPTAGWDKVARAVAIHDVPGDHETAKARYAPALAACIQECLDHAREIGQ